MLAISVDPPEALRAMVDQERLPFPVLADPSREVTRAFGLLHSGAGPGGSDIALPANLLIGADGRLLWKYVSPRVQDRMDPATLLEVVARHR